MTAKEIKMRTLRKQQEFIQEQLDRRVMSLDGDAGYTFIGDICMEVITHFEGKGWQVICTGDRHKGMPIYRFSYAETKLTPKELKQAMSFEYEKDNELLAASVADMFAELAEKVNN